jgi:Caspase domain
VSTAKVTDIVVAGTKAELKGCVNDVKSMQAMLTEHFAFPPNNIKVLIDVGQGEKPTGKAIKDNMRAIVQACKPGDVLFIHFSGHGTQVADKDGDDADKKDEAIVPTDLNIITDDDLRDILGKLPENVRLTMVHASHATNPELTTNLQGN